MHVQGLDQDADGLGECKGLCVFRDVICEVRQYVWCCSDLGILIFGILFLKKITLEHCCRCHWKVISLTEPVNMIQYLSVCLLHISSSPWLLLQVSISPASVCTQNFQHNALECGILLSSNHPSTV